MNLCPNRWDEIIKNIRGLDIEMLEKAGQNGAKIDRKIMEGCR